MPYAKVVIAILTGLTLGCGGGDGADSAADTSDVPGAGAVGAADLPDPCALVGDEEVSELLWRDMASGQREALQARSARHEFTRRVEDVSFPAGRTCHVAYRRVAADSVWGEGDFRLRTLDRQAFDMLAGASSSRDPIAGVGDQAFYMSNAAYARRGDVGVEVVDFGSKDVEIELLKRAVAKLP